MEEKSDTELRITACQIALNYIQTVTKDLTPEEFHELALTIYVFLSEGIKG